MYYVSYICGRLNPFMVTQLICFLIHIPCHNLAQLGFKPPPAWVCLSNRVRHRYTISSIYTYRHNLCQTRTLDSHSVFPGYSVINTASGKPCSSYNLGLYYYYGSRQKIKVIVNNTPARFICTMSQVLQQIFHNDQSRLTNQ